MLVIDEVIDMEHRWNDADWEIPKYWEENLSHYHGNALG
jgi:hypothetical protein